MRAYRRFGVESILVDRIPIPDLPGVSVAPNPLFLAQECVVVNCVRWAALGVNLVAARGVVFQLGNRVEDEGKGVLMF